MHAVDAWAEKPDSAFGPEVWSREKELLSSIDSVSNPEEVALTYLKLARIFRDNHRELTYLDRAEEAASKTRAPEPGVTIMLLRLEFYSAYGAMSRFSDYAEFVKGRLGSMKDRRLSNVEYLVIKRHVDEGHTQTALVTARDMLSSATAANDKYRQAYAYYSIGLIYQAVERYGEATDALEKSVAIMNAALKDFPPLDYIKAQLELLSTQYSVGRYAESLKTCKAAADRLDKFIASEDPDFQMGINCMSMRLHIECYAVRNYLAMNELALASKHLDAASDCMYPEIGLDREIFNETSAMYYDRIGDFGRALDYADLSVNAFKASGLAPYYIEALTLKKRFSRIWEDGGRLMRTRHWSRRRRIRWIRRGLRVNWANCRLFMRWTRCQPRRNASKLCFCSQSCAAPCSCPLSLSILSITTGSAGRTSLCMSRSIPICAMWVPQPRCFR